MNPKKSYPSGYRRMQARLDNLAIWIKGGFCGGWMEHNLESYIAEKQESYDKQIRQIEQKLRSIHTKTVKGNEYFYRVEGGQWIYIGREDPSANMKVSKAALEAEKNKIKADMQLCVKKKIKEHLVIDIELFKLHVSKKLPENMIQISEALR